eukprot:2852350-Rhodomonas_salina.1
MHLWQINFKSWNDALQTKDPATVANLYSTSDLSFLPTVSPEHIKNSDSTVDYFTAFVQKHPFGTITDDSVQVYGNGNAYLHSGMYTFELGEGDARAPVDARFSYVWRKIEGVWKITHHHSSVRPGINMRNVARENFQKWNDALQTKDPKKVASLYSTSDLSFLPTVSPEHIKDLDNTEDYFTAFVQKHPFGTITDDSVTVFDDGEAYLHSGMYTFELGEGDARAPVEARFSYVWRKSGDGEYKITHHHSSVRPEAPAPTSKFCTPAPLRSPYTQIHNATPAPSAEAEAPAKEPEVKKEAPKVEKKEPVAVASKAVIEEDKEEVQELKAKYTETAQKLQTETLRRIEHEKQLKEVPFRDPRSICL